MIKRLCIAIVMVFAMASMAAAATVAVATGNVNLRAGPSTGYPVVVVVPVGARIVTHGCLPGYTWCDIGFGSYRGWVSARYVQVVYNGAPVVLSPAVWVKVLGNAQAVFPYDHPAIISMTLAFVVTWLGSVTDKSARAAKEAEAFEEQYIRAQTGLGAAGAHAH